MSGIFCKKKSCLNKGRCTYSTPGDPVMSGPFPEGGCEGPQVGDHASGDEHVTNQVVKGVLQLLGGLGPPGLFSTQSTNQLLRSHQLLTTQVHLGMATFAHMTIAYPGNKRAQRALGRSPEEKVKGNSGANNREPQGHNLNNFGRGPFDDVIY